MSHAGETEFRQPRRAQPEAHVWRRFAAASILLVASFALLHAAGLREHVSVLCGTPGNVGGDPAVSTLFGAAYVLAHVAAVLGAPVLVLAVALHGLLGWVGRSVRRLPLPR